MRKRGPVEIIAGALTLAGLIGLFAFAYTVDSRAASGYALTARYTSVDGLAEAAPVWLSGVRIGTVEKIRFDPEFRDAVVTLRIAGNVKLPADSSAAVMSQGLLGGKFVMVSPGGDTTMMADGDEFQYVQNSVIMEEVLQVIVRSAERRAAERKAAEQKNKPANP